ncbi:MAG: hypothetical protein U1F56_07495 [Rubrivivax sp.]
MSSALTDPLHALSIAAAPLESTAAELPIDPFVARPSGATIVYKRRRLAEAAAAPSSEPPAADGDGGERRPRVVRVPLRAGRVPGGPDAAHAADPAAPPPEQAPSPARPRRRRARDPLRAPGEVKHIVFERGAGPGPDGDGSALAAGATWAPMYPPLRQALDDVATTLEQAAQLRLLARELQALLPASGGAPRAR